MATEKPAGSEPASVRRAQQALAAGILGAMPARDREVMMRFYLDGQPAEQIQAEMGVVETEFELIKSRAKASFLARLPHRPITSAVE